MGRGEGEGIIDGIGRVGFETLLGWLYCSICSMSDNSWEECFSEREAYLPSLVRAPVSIVQKVFTKLTEP